MTELAFQATNCKNAKTVDSMFEELQSLKEQSLQQNVVIQQLLQNQDRLENESRQQDDLIRKLNQNQEMLQKITEEQHVTIRDLQHQCQAKLKFNQTVANQPNTEAAGKSDSIYINLLAMSFCQYAPVDKGMRMTIYIHV